MTGLAPLTLLYVALNATGLFLLRNALGGTSSVGLLSVLAKPSTIVGLALYAASFCTFVLALRYHPLSVVFPLFAGLGYMAVALGGWLIFDERMSPLHVAGVVLVGLGVVLIHVR